MKTGADFYDSIVHFKKKLFQPFYTKSHYHFESLEYWVNTMRIKIGQL